MAAIMNLFWISVAVYFYSVGTNCVRIEKNGYKDIAIAFSEYVKQDSIDFQKLKFVFSNASELLYHATRRRSYLEEFVFVVPSTWTGNGVCEEYVTEAPQKVDLYFTDSPEVKGLRTQHSKGCGQEGDIIYVPLKWLQGEVGDLAAQFVQQWSTFRYGVFSEKPEKFGSCFSTSDNTWSPAGCYNIELNVQPQFDGNGLPVCYLPEDFTEREDLLSSIMFTTNSSKVSNYCDGSRTFPHNPIAPSLHNRICGGQTVWSVIKNTEDFMYGRNLPLKDDKPPSSPAFRCFREPKTHVTLTIQNSSVGVLSETITEIRYALLHFLTTMVPTDSRVDLITFSDAASAQSVELKLDKNALRSTLDAHLKQNNPVSNVCFTCGLEKAYEDVADNQHSSQVIVLLSWENSFDNTKTSSAVDLIQSHPKTILYLLFVGDDDDDILNDTVPPVLVDAVQAVGGRIFRLQKESVFMVTQLNIALLDAFRNALRVEDQTVVVHEKMYVNVTSDFTDTFLTPRAVRGKLLYTMHCQTRGIIRNVNDTCKDWDTDSLTYKCGDENTTVYYKPPVTVWRHHFERIDNIRPITCSSLAMMRLETPSTGPFTVRGWLNTNKVIPGRNALIIYAEIFGTKCHEFQVQARISGPGLEDFRLDLRDNGNGDPDTTKDDGIFSRYFTSYAQKGTYVVSIHATCRVPERDITYTDDIPDYDERKLTQMKIIGTFSITETPSSREDILPPNRIMDLAVVSINHQNRTVLLQWTAPGDDYDHGTAFQYIFKLSNNWMTLLDFTFNDKENILLTQPHGFLPAKSGVLQSLEFQFLQANINTTYSIATLATDATGNKAKVSNIVQISFTEIEVTVIDNLTTPSENINYDKTTTLYSTDINNITSGNFTVFEITESTTENNENITGNQTKEGIFIEKKTAIIAFSTAGGVILLLIIINIIVCCCCLMKNRKTKDANKLSRKGSLKPPYNLNIAYRYGSESSLDGETEVANALRTLVDQTINYSNLQGRTQSEQRYAYHTNKSLMNKERAQDRKGELGFKVVESMPAYATSSLSRFASRHAEVDDECEPSALKSNIVQQSTNIGDAHIYSLGVV